MPFVSPFQRGLANGCAWITNEKELNSIMGLVQAKIEIAIETSPQLIESLHMARQVALQTEVAQVLPEHLQLAMLEDDESSFLLEAYGVDFKKVRAQLAKQAKKLSQPGSPGQQAVFSPHIETIMQHARVQAQKNALGEVDSNLVLAVMLSEKSGFLGKQLAPYDLDCSGVLQYLELREGKTVNIDPLSPLKSLNAAAPPKAVAPPVNIAPASAQQVPAATIAAPIVAPIVAPVETPAPLNQPPTNPPMAPAQQQVHAPTAPLQTNPSVQPPPPPMVSAPPAVQKTLQTEPVPAQFRQSQVAQVAQVAQPTNTPAQPPAQKPPAQKLPHPATQKAAPQEPHLRTMPPPISNPDAYTGSVAAPENPPSTPEPAPSKLRSLFSSFGRKNKAQSATEANTGPITERVPSSQSAIKATNNNVQNPAPATNLISPPQSVDTLLNRPPLPEQPQTIEALHSSAQLRNKPAKRRRATPDSLGANESLSATGSVLEKGRLVENIPRHMKVNIPTPAEVRITRTQMDEISSEFENLSSSHIHELAVTEAMTVQLRAPGGGFHIENLSPQTQWIDRNQRHINDADFGAWKWNVTPTTSGKSRLQLVISARTVDDEGTIHIADIPDKIIELGIARDHRNIAKKTGIIALVAITSLVLGKYGEAALHGLSQLTNLAG